MSTTAPSPRRLGKKAWVAVGALGVILAGIITVASISNDTELARAEATDLAGVHVLQQVDGQTISSGMRSQIVSALNVPGVTAFGIRVPWSSLESTNGAFNSTVLDSALAIANSTGDELTVRFMAGSHVPARVRTACTVGGWMLGSGTTSYAKPFNATGQLNTCFLNEYRTVVQNLATWARANAVHELHLSHYAKDWAEFYWGPEVQAIAGSGATGQTYMVNATNALVDIGLAVAGDDLTVELPMSGHGPLMRSSATSPPGIAERVTQHVVQVIGADNPRFLIQGNGWDTDGIWGATATAEANFDYVLTYGAVLGVQMIQPQQYNWTQVFNVAEAKKAMTAEIYLPSFVQGTASGNGTAAQIAQLKAEIDAWVPYVPTGGGPGPTTTTTAPTTTTTTTAPTTTTTTTLPPTTTTTTVPVGTCEARWNGTVVESRQSTQAACSLA